MPTVILWYFLCCWLGKPDASPTNQKIVKPQSSLHFLSGFKGSVHYHHGKYHGSIQADMVLEELRVLHLVPQATKWD